MKRTESAGGVVMDPGGRILVVNQRGNSWSLPKGHVAAGEDALSAARREVLEESGVSDLELVRPLGSYQRHRIGRYGGEDTSELKSIHMFLFRTRQTDLAPRDPNNPEARWVGREDVASFLTHPRDRDFFQRCLAELPEA